MSALPASATMALCRSRASLSSGCMGALGPSKVRVHHTRIGHMVKLVEESSGEGELLLRSLVLRQVRYQIKVFQGMFGNGMPNPTARTVEGSIEAGGLPDLVGTNLTLKLEDGRTIGVIIADQTGAIHQRPACTTGCSCC